MRDLKNKFEIRLFLKNKQSYFILGQSDKSLSKEGFISSFKDLERKGHVIFYTENNDLLSDSTYYSYQLGDVSIPIEEIEDVIYYNLYENNKDTFLGSCS